MTRKLHGIAAATASLALAACASSATPAQESPMPNASATAASRLLPVKQWPLRFETHSFGAHCYSTYGCKVIYAGLEQRSDDPDELRPSSENYGPEYQRNWSGTHGMIRNFPPPAQVTWRSKDGQLQQAEIDIGAIFRDELIRHNVPREEMADEPEGEFQGEPAILLEVNDRTIRVYMRVFISTKELQKPGNVYSDFRNDLILVKTFTY